MEHKLSHDDWNQAVAAGRKAWRDKKACTPAVLGVHQLAWEAWRHGWIEEERLDREDQRRRQSSEPRIFITIERKVEGHPVCAMRELDLHLWLRKHPDGLVGSEIDAMLREVQFR